MRRIAVLAAMLLLAGCAGAGSPAPSATASAGSLPSLPAGALREPIRTFALYTPTAGSALACPAYLISPNISGALAGEPGDPEHVWLVGPSGRRISVVWPAGFSLFFKPEATLYDGSGALFARAGDGILLGQVRAGSHAGTPADPYLAAGLIEARPATGDTREACAPAADGTPYGSPAASSDTSPAAGITWAVYNRTLATIAAGPVASVAACSSGRVTASETPLAPVASGAEPPGVGLWNVPVPPGVVAVPITVEVPRGGPGVVSVVVTSSGARTTLGEISPASLPPCSGQPPAP